MTDTLAQIVRRAIDPADVREEGTHTDPRSYGVYQLPHDTAALSRFHFGNHPVRMQELERQFGSCTLTYLFEGRDDAEEVARTLNGRDT